MACHMPVPLNHRASKSYLEPSFSVEGLGLGPSPAHLPRLSSSRVPCALLQLIPVSASDVAFSIHAVTLTALTAAQIYFYDVSPWL